MVFIGVVTASMVKNAASQSTAAAGYGSRIVMASTSKSAKLATESYFENENNLEPVLQKINNILDGGTASEEYLIGVKNRRTQLAGNQYFSSRFNSIYNPSGRYYADFDVDVGKSASGRGLDKARAFYEVIGLRLEDSLVPNVGFINAFYMGKGRIVATSGLNMRVEGYATFAYDSVFQQTFNSGQPTKAVFTRDSKNRGDVYFNSRVNIQPDDGVVFETPVFFKKSVILQSNSSSIFDVFKSDAGFFQTMGGNYKTYGFTGNVWINKGHKALDTVSNSPATLRGVSGKRLYHTDSLPFKSGAACDIQTPPCKHGVFPWDHLTEPAGFTRVPMANQMTEKAMLDSVKVVPLNDRREGDLELALPGGKSFYSLRILIQTVASSGTTVSGSQLSSFIADARKNSSFNANFVPDRENPNSHFLINVDNDISWNGGTFNEKVVFSHTDGSKNMNYNYNFYHSGSNASTLIFLGSTARITNFSIKAASPGLFRGIIYVHHNNTLGHEFNMRENGGNTAAKNVNIEGALIFNGGRELAAHGGVLTVSRNDDIVNAICMLGILKDPTRPGTVVAGSGKVTADEVRLKPLGFYSY